MDKYSPQTSKINADADLGNIGIYVIGLEDGYRGAPLENELKEAGLNFTRVYGVQGTYEGRSVKEFTDPEANQRLHGRELTDGEIGCALAHRGAHLTFLDSDNEWALILEDDVTLNSVTRFPEILKSTVEKQPQGITLFYARGALGSPDGVPIDKNRSVLRQVLTTPFSATAYLMHRSTAQYLVEHSMPIIGPADWPTRIEGKVEFNCIFPWAFTPRENEESAVGIRPAAQGNLWKKIRYWLARILHIQWFVNMSYYGSYQTYFHREVRSFIIRHITQRQIPYIVNEEQGSLPIANKISMAFYRITSRNNRFSNTKSDLIE